MYMNYKNQLKAYSKKLFDPFCRRERILFQIPDHEPFLTTVGKLNFFRWAIEKEVLNYIKGHQPEIEKEMNQAMREQAKLRTGTTPTSRGDSQKSDASYDSVATSVLSTNSGTRKRSSNREVSAIKLLQKHDCPIEMRFD